MSRKRELSTDVSMDERIADLSGYGYLAVTLYLMAIPQADDWGRLPGKPREFKMLVCPGFDATVAEIDEALSNIETVGLWNRYEADGKQCIAFPPKTWFKRQSYINNEKRSNDSGSRFPANQQFIDYKNSVSADTSAKQQETARNSVSPSPTPSPSPSPTLSPTSNPPTPHSEEEPASPGLVGSVVGGGENKFSGSGSVLAVPGNGSSGSTAVFLEDCVEPLKAKGYSGGQIRNAIAEAKEHPPKGPIRNSIALLEKIMQRQTTESGSNGVHAPPERSSAAPPIPPELKAWREEHDIPLAVRLERADALLTKRNSGQTKGNPP